MPLHKNGFLEKIETWHVGLYTHFMSFSSKSEHDTVADQATLTKVFWFLINTIIFKNSFTFCKSRKLFVL